MELTRLNLLPRCLPACIVLFAVVMRCVSYLHDDVSWLITMAEQILAGREAYVDIIDVNPPASFLIYTLQAAAAGVLGISTELVVTLSVFATALGSTLITAWALTNAGEITKGDFPYYSSLLLMILLVLCGDVFAQREHFALIGILPLLSCYTARAVGRIPSNVTYLVAGIGGCVVLALKPHFALALVLPFCYCVWHAQKKDPGFLNKVFWPENVIILLGSSVYVTAILTVFPKYLETVVPIALDLYVPFRLSADALLIRSSSWAIAGSGLLALASLCGGKARPFP